MMAGPTPLSRRWLIERVSTWLQNFRQPITPFEGRVADQGLSISAASSSC